MKSLKLLFFAVSLGVLAFSCSKTGPAGPAGPTGPTGVANIATTTYTVTPGQWSTYSAGAAYDVILSVPGLTNSNTDNVQVSASESNTNGNWFLIPATSTFTSGDETAVLYANGQVEIVYLYSVPPNVTGYFKVTVIPPAMIVQHPNLTKQQIIELYGQQPLNSN